MGAAALKDVLDPAQVRALAAELRSACPHFDATAFVTRSVAGLEGLELSARAWQIAEAMHAHLPRPFAAAAAVISASLGPEIEATGENGLAPLRYMPHVFYVQKYGLDDFDAAMRVQAELTKRFSAEFSIRAYLVKYPQRAYAQMLAWARDGDAHLRRLASEGTRPRLPWAPRLRGFQDDPRPVLALLEMLKDDPSLYVRRSVANNLNDISKDHPDLTVETCRRWAVEAPADRQWLIRHALRSLIKAGNREALSILGAGERPQLRVDKMRLMPRRARIGGEVRFALEVVSTGRAAQRLMVDYVVHFVKANGATAPKVFKLRRLTLAPSARHSLEARVSLAPMTTRRHYPGEHRLELQVNGVRLALGSFEVYG